MLKAINPDATKTIEVNGAKFEIGAVPYQKFIELQAALTGLGVEKIKSMPKEVYDVYIEYVRWGIRGHSDIEINGEPVPFDTEEVTFAGKKYKVVSDKTVQLYVTNQIYIQLAAQVMAYNKLSKEEEKN